MTAFPRRATMSIDEYLQMDRSSAETRSEYIDGHVYAMAGGTIAHARIALNMAKLLDEQLGSGPCHTYTSDVRVQLSEKRYVYPDVTVSCDISDWQEQADIIHAPHLIVEVLSPTTEAYERGKKFTCYQECSTIQEYVLISSQYQAVEVFRRKKDVWLYRRYAAEQEVELESLDIRFLVAALYERIRVPVKDES